MPLKGWETGYAQGVADTMAKIKDSRAAGYRAGVSDTLAAMGRKHGIRDLGGKVSPPMGAKRTSKRPGLADSGLKVSPPRGAKSLTMTWMNKLRYDCEQCPFKSVRGKCPSEELHGPISAGGARIGTCAAAVVQYLKRPPRRG